MSDSETLLRELVKQQQVANVIAALSCRRASMLGDFDEVAEKFVLQSVLDIVRFDPRD